MIAQEKLYKAAVTVEGSYLFIGRYESAEEAGKAYNTFIKNSGLNYPINLNLGD